MAVGEDTATPPVAPDLFARPTIDLPTLTLSPPTVGTPSEIAPDHVVPTASQPAPAPPIPDTPTFAATAPIAPPTDLGAPAQPIAPAAPVPTAAPVAPIAPVPVAPIAPAPAPVAPVAPIAPVAPAPVAPVAPAPIAPAAPVAPVAPVQATAPQPPTVPAPVVAATAPAPAAPVMPPAVAPTPAATAAPALPSVPSAPAGPAAAPTTPTAPMDATGHPNPVGQPSIAGSPNFTEQAMRRSSMLWTALTALVVIVLVAVGLLRDQIFTSEPGGQPADAAEGAASTPDAWAPEVAPIARFVAEERGLAFDHPVPVEFVAEADYVALFTTDRGEPDSETVLRYRSLSELYNAAGLAVGFDLLAGESTVASVATLGFYVPAEDRIYIRGTEITPAVETVLAHELTHALQAQHFDSVLGGADDLAVRSVLEADASRVEDAYLATLTPAEQQAVWAENSFDADDANALSRVPDALVQQRSAPYILGPMLIDEVFAAQGNGGVDYLLRNTPTEELLLNPTTWGSTDVDAVPDIAAPIGATIIEEPQQASLLDMLIMLDAWLPWTEARGAVDGWQGGGYVSYERADSIATCFAVNLSFDDSPAAFSSAVEAWAVAAGSAAVPVVDGNRVSFEACNRGAGAAEPPVPTVTLTEAAWVENEVMKSVPDGASDDVVAAQRCYARTMIDNEAVSALLFIAEPTADELESLAWGQNLIAAGCGVTFD